MAVGDPVLVLADFIVVCGASDRQDVLEQGGSQAEGDQRGPAGFQIQQLWCCVLGEQFGQRAEGRAVRRLAATAVKARAGKGDIAEHGAENDLVLSLAAQAAMAGGTAAMPVDIGRHLGFDHRVLEPAEQVLGVLQAHVASLSSLLSISRITSSRITVSSSLTMRS